MKVGWTTALVAVVIAVVALVAYWKYVQPRLAGIV